jgi:hypothetical protein
VAFGVTYLAHAGRGAVYTCPKCLVRRRARDAIELVRGGAPWCDHHCRNFKRDGTSQCLWTFICPSHVGWRLAGTSDPRERDPHVLSRDTTLSLAALTLEKTHYLVPLTDHMLITQMGDAQLARAGFDTRCALARRPRPRGTVAISAIRARAAGAVNTDHPGRCCTTTDIENPRAGARAAQRPSS